jgi:hypothetical protein
MRNACRFQNCVYVESNGPLRPAAGCNAPPSGDPTLDRATVFTFPW